MIVMELCAEGDLSDRINQEFGRPVGDDGDDDEDVDEDDLPPLPTEPISEEAVISEGQVLRWLGQMADALAFIHSKHIIHRDIKSQVGLVWSGLVWSGLVRSGPRESPQTLLGHRRLCLPY
eukprot:SAG22_NODE_6952_length_791_cov_1.734104_2_plen_121_part_00